MLHVLLGDYQYWKVFAVNLPQPMIELPPGVSISPVVSESLKDLSIDDIDQSAYCGDQALGFALYVEGELAAIQGVWWGDRYERERKGRSWRLPAGAAKTNNLYTLPEFRGKGYAVLLKQYTNHVLSDYGFTSVYCRIWHSHRGSIRVSRKAGMRLVGAYIEICPFGRRIELRIPMRGR